jgi:hypothetical protein
MFQIAAFILSVFEILFKTIWLGGGGEFKYDIFDIL